MIIPGGKGGKKNLYELEKNNSIRINHPNNKRNTKKYYEIKCNRP